MKSEEHQFSVFISKKKCVMISRVIRFINKSTRQEHRTQDKLAPIRELWNKWI